MEIARLTGSLRRFHRILPAAVSDLDRLDAQWRPAGGQWSVLEIVSHLADEEQLDFSARIRQTLADPTAPWDPIDPERWAVDRRYNEGSLEEAVPRFCDARAESLEWLATLDSTDWTTTHHHPRHGPFQAGDLLAAWAAHDWLHLRQIAKRCFEMTQRDGHPFSTRYAGDWSA